MDPKGQAQNAPPAGFYVPPQPPPAYDAGQFQPQQQQHLVQRKNEIYIKGKPLWLVKCGCVF